MWRSELRASALVVALGVGIVMACGTDQENVCEDIGNCEQGGSTAWIEGCKIETKLLKRVATGAGCGAGFDDYFDCASSSFDCRGATAVFPGCEGRLASLDDCITRAAASTACGLLASRTSACRAGADGGTPATDATPALPLACTAARECQARCFLDAVRDVCAPQVEELPLFNLCASQCPTR